MEKETIKKCIVCGMLIAISLAELNFLCEKCSKEETYHLPENKYQANLSISDFSTYTSSSASISGTTSTITTQQYFE